MTSLREAMLKKLYFDQDPLLGIPPGELRLQHWNSNHPYLVEAITPEVHLVIELGVWKGDSTLEMAQRMWELGLDAVVLGVDTWRGSWDHWLSPGWFFELPKLYDTFRTNVVTRRLCRHVLPLPLDSASAFWLLQRTDFRADVLHIDGAHDYDSVKTDLSRWLQLLRPGGLVICDDYGTWPEVTRAVDDFLGKAPREAYRGKCRFTLHA